MGASMAGLRAAERLREEAFTGSLTLIGQEPQEPNHRLLLSKQVLTWSAPLEDTSLPRHRTSAPHGARA
ncbi:hypothetical protein BJQ90_01194 [Arthrobacter sp. SO3]|nr:hypothetical protein [Arthrobacter sp. SO3]